jgi:hypothetical protein
MCISFGNVIIICKETSCVQNNKKTEHHFIFLPYLSLTLFYYFICSSVLAVGANHSKQLNIFPEFSRTLSKKSVKKLVTSHN